MNHPNTLDHPSPSAGNNSSAMSHASMDSFDLLGSPGSQSVSSLGQIHEGDARPVPPLAAFKEEQVPNRKPTDAKAVIYQLDFDVDHVGKNKPASKRLAYWKYGIERDSSNGIKIEEHEAQLTWSTHSGRWCVSVDGSDVYAGQTKGSVLDFKWKWNHRQACVSDDDALVDGEPIVSMRIAACRKPPIRTSKDFRCYEFILEGKPFRLLPHLTGNQEMDFENENCSDGKLTTILDIVEPTWRSSGFV